VSHRKYATVLASHKTLNLRHKDERGLISARLGQIFNVTVM